MPNVTLPRADIPAVEQDDRGRMVLTRDFYRWASDLTSRAGGATGSIPDASEAFEDAGIEETKASVYRLNDDISQSPVVQELMFLTEDLTSQVQMLSALLDEVLKRLNGYEQGTLQ